MTETKSTGNHSFRYDGGKILVSGVLNVDSFDDKEVVLRLFDNALTLRGSGFKMEEMEVKTGIINMEGRLYALTYHEKAEKLSFVKRLFK